MARIPFLTLTLLWVTTANLQAGNRIIPYLVQTPDFSTTIQIINLCSEPSGYLIHFIGSDGERTDFAFSSGELWSGVYEEDISPGANYFFSLPESEDEIRQGYGEIVDDGNGCIAFEVSYRQSLPDGSFKWARTVPRPLSSSGVAVPFFFMDSETLSCDTAVAIAGDGTRVSLEATDGITPGETLDRIELGPVYFAAVTVKDQFPLASANNNGSSAGVLRILGNVSAVASLTCNGELIGYRYVHPLPSATQREGYEVVSFAAKYLGYNMYSGHQYSYRLELRNPTQTKRTYRATLLFRDADGFVVHRTGLWGGPSKLHVAAGRTRLFEDTQAWVYFDNDPSEITVDVEIREVR